MKWPTEEELEREYRRKVESRLQAERPPFPKPKKRSPFLAAILSFFTGGVGQIYIGQTRKGVLLTAMRFLLDLFSCASLSYAFANLMFGVRSTRAIEGLSRLFVFMDWVLAIVGSCDAYFLARRVNRGERIEDWDWFGSSKLDRKTIAWSGRLKRR